MTIDPALQELITELGQQLGLDDLRLDEQGFCALRFDDKLLVNLQYWGDGEQLMLFTDLGPPAAGAGAYPILLRANLFWRATLGATLSLSEDDPPHVIIALQQSWQTLDGTQLGSLLERFVNTVEDWAEAVQNPAGDTETEAEVAPGITDGVGMMRV